MKLINSYAGGLFLMLCLISVPNHLFAQEKNTVSGKVFDESGQTVPGANVSLTGSDQTVTTDVNGSYLFSNVAAGTYTISATNVGYKSFGKKVTVKEGEAVVENLFLETESQNLKEVVVTGSSSPRSKLESSVAITSMGAKAIEDRAPASTAALLQTIPGFVVEASGGEIGNNLFARGIPSAGAYEYVQIQEDGLPVFEDGALQFANADTFYRLDETVSKMEAVRGGSASIFANNAPGGIINFISKTGQNDFQGRAKFSTSDYGMFRTDLNLSGALIQDKLFFNIGGFYRADNGVRNTGFTANKGGQIKGNLTYKFDDGDYLRVNFKHLDDRNTFYLPIPLKSNNGKIEGIDGFNPNYGTLTSVNFSHLNVPQYGGGTFSADLEDGSHPVINSVGAEFKKKISEKVTFKNAFKQTAIDLNYNAIFPNGGPWTQDAYATGIQNTTAANLDFTYVDNGAAVDPNALIMRADHWYIHKKMNNFANNFSFAFDLDPVKLTAGYYYSNWKSNQYWNWNSYLVSVSDNPRLLNVEDNTTGVNHTWNGVERITWLERDAQTKGVLNDIYADAEIKATENLTFNAGVRYNKDKYSGYRDNARFFAENLGVLDNNTADDAVTTVKGNPYTYWRYDVSELSYTGAANYKFNDNMASYVRYSHGFRSPIEESFYDNAADLSKLENTKVNQLELGYKYSGSFFSVNANVFHMNLKNVAFTDILSDGTSENKFADVNNIGLEVETNARYEIVNLNFTFTVQKPEYDNFTGTNADGSTFDFNGNTARRIPKFFCNLRPEVDITKDFTAYVQFSYYDKKFTNQDNKQVLPAYKEVGAGLNYTYNNLRFAVDASNLFNEIGLTEGDPRQTTSAASDVFMARPILGRAFRFSVAVNF
ncbi:TonB-dependent receptor [Flavobacterium circumlabens]|uniref:Outer membrane receptor protein involved in Fe transport n=1 Tax=Flavobacterium circumlabens TaxID=2133765 RepID=A0A4Y7UFA9_9FLAO|nr:TonB-dependent receptor [Flavobacterium circumlabens]TCN59903.1 outer membrane receptor protein involved in Fe transport [Flavobacterium circumlabens]TEB45153.1 TonB-dependent receptor [Flavobacterium circumlabens]